MRKLLAHLPIDGFIVLLLATVGVASVLPARGLGAVIAGHAVTVAIALLFFLYGARLGPQAALDGARNVKLHALVFSATFALFPALSLVTRALFPHVLTPALWSGVILLCVLPSTVQSSIAFTSIARGNVPAALCSATLSNLIGIVLTPLLAGVLLATGPGGVSAGKIGDIVLQLLVPFAAGQALRPWIGAWAARNRTLLSAVDRGSILVVVYAAFSEGMVAGIWRELDLAMLLRLFLVNAALLAAVLTATTFLSRKLGFNRADEITIVFCGSKKSLASGLPIASVLFAGSSVGLLVLPMMLFHQLQLMVCAVLARRYAAREAAGHEAGLPAPPTGQGLEPQRQRPGAVFQCTRRQVSATGRSDDLSCAQ
jgi:solute carrier family 10 (sodium/bile acid cotransporter), member 7